MDDVAEDDRVENGLLSMVRAANNRDVYPRYKEQMLQAAYLSSMPTGYLYACIDDRFQRFIRVRMEWSAKL